MALYKHMHRSAYNSMVCHVAEENPKLHKTPTSTPPRMESEYSRQIHRTD